MKRSLVAVALLALVGGLGACDFLSIVNNNTNDNRNGQAPVCSPLGGACADAEDCCLGLVCREFDGSLSCQPAPTPTPTPSPSPTP